MKKFEDIAVIGMDGLFPKAANIEALEHVFSEGLDCIEAAPQNRLKLCGLSAPEQYVERGYLEHIEYFDYEYFGYSKGEAELLNPTQRTAMQVAVHTVEDAGYSLKKMKATNTSVILAISQNTYFSTLNDKSGVAYNSNEVAMAAARIADFMKLQGKAYTVDTTCSSSLLAVHQGCCELMQGECDMVLAGGVNIQIVPYTKEFLQNGSFGIISDSYRCKSFDANSSGTGVGEGAAMVLLKRLEDAKRDHDRIYGVIKGSYANHSGGRANSLIAPSSDAQGECIIQAWERADMKAENIGMIETHGTGTKIGDPIEVQGIEDAFRHFGVTKRKSCALSAAKSNIGHLGLAAGIASFVKGILAVREGKKYPIVHFQTGNPLIPWEDSVVYPCERTESWKEPVRIAGISSFGLSGTNVHTVVANVPEIPEEEPKLTTNILKISARTKAGIQDYKKNYQEFLNTHHVSPTALAYTANTGRDDYRFRLAVAYQKTEELEAKLELAEPVDCNGLKKEIYYLCAGEEMETDSLVSEYQASMPQFQEVFKAYQEPYERAPAYGKYLIFHKVLVTALKAVGVHMKGVLGCGQGNGIVKYINGEASLEVLCSQQEQLRSTPFQEEAFIRFANTLKEQAVFIGFGRDNHLLNALEKETGFQAKRYDTRCAMELITDLYQVGAKLDWEQYYGSGYPIISAPAYPFQKETCFRFVKPAKEISVSEQEEETEYPKISEDSVEQFVYELWVDNLKKTDISLDDDFFELGGNSIMSLKIIQEFVERYGEVIELDDFYDYSTIRELAAYIRENGEMIEDKENQEVTSTDALDNIYRLKPIPEQEYYEVTDAQKRMWILTVSAPESVAYNMACYLNVYGKLDVERVAYVFKELVRLHESFRTSFHSIDGKLMQKIHKEVEFKVDFYQNPDMDVYDLVKPFALDQAPLIRSSVIQRGEESYTIFLDLHHIISDGTSMSILLRSFIALYEGKTIPSPVFTYKDFTYWQNDFMKTDFKKKQDDYWKEELKDLVNYELELPLDYERPAFRTDDGEVYETYIEADLLADLQEFAGQYKVTMNVLLLSSFFIVLHKCRKQDIVSIGMPIAGRRGEEQYTIIGMFVNMLIIKMNMKEDMTYEEFIEALKRKAFKAYANQDSQFNDVIEMMNFQRKANKNPFFDMVFALQEIEMPELKIDGLRFDSGNLDRTAKFDMVCTSMVTQGRMMFSMKFWNKIFKRETIAALLHDVIHVLRQAITHPELKISEITIQRTIQKVEETSLDDISFDLDW